jgi:hypothetical protein
MGQIAERTRYLLLRRNKTQSLSDRQRDQLMGTLEHLGEVREGFQLSLRNPSGAYGELRDIVRHTLQMIDWSFLEELGLQLQGVNQVERLDNQFTAFAHATVALAMLPMLPASEVSHPTSSHYRDLRKPQRPGEWLERIEELESAMTRLHSNARSEASSLPPETLRRTHAYFDASAWLVRSHLRTFRAY